MLACKHTLTRTKKPWRQRPYRSIGGASATERLQCVRPLAAVLSELSCVFLLCYLLPVWIPRTVEPTLYSEAKGLPSFACAGVSLKTFKERTGSSVKTAFKCVPSLLMCVMLHRQTEETDKEAYVCGCVSALGLGTELPSISDALFALTIVPVRMSHLCALQLR